MLTLSRRPGEAVELILEDGTRLVVQIDKTSPSRVVLSFDAPAAVGIKRTHNRQKAEAQP
jgi:sRNA-binding carbon storage regulator CsrA